MQTLVIPSSYHHDIHSLADQFNDREIRFPKGHRYAVVLASYYGGKGYTTHKSEEAAMFASRKAREYSHKILDASGNIYDAGQGHLVAVGAICHEYPAYI